MSPTATRLFFQLSLVIALLSSICAAWTLPFLGLGAAPPPAALLTTDISPQCKSTNNGTYLCCASAVQGGNPIVVAAADAAGYQLPANTLNGIECKKTSDSCSDLSTPVCCQVTTLLPLVGLWCRYM